MFGRGKEPSEELRSPTDAEIEQRAAERKAKHEAAVAQFKVEDEAVRVAAQSFVPDIGIESYPVGSFLRVGKSEWPLRFIEGISITDHGSPPELQSMIRPTLYLCESVVYWAHPAVWATITVRMSSGQEHKVNCNRHEVLFLHDAMVAAWKGGYR